MFKYVILPFALISMAAAQRGAYNSSCTPGTIDYDCDERAGFLCDRETSRCLCVDKNEMEYDETAKICKVFLWANCYTLGRNLDMITLTCKDDNAQCIIEDNGGWYPSSECVCNAGHIPTTDGEPITPDARCLPSHGKSCVEGSLPCHESTKAVCTHGRCQCEHPLSQYFDLGEKMCLGMSEAPNSCTPGAPPLNCGSYATCGEDGVCHCIEGFSADFGFPRECRKSQGQSCTITNSTDLCNADRGLKCMDGACECEREPDVTWDEDKQICAVKEGFTCTLDTHPAIVDTEAGTKTLLRCAGDLTCNKNGDDPHFGVCGSSK